MIRYNKQREQSKPQEELYLSLNCRSPDTIDPKHILRFLRLILWCILREMLVDTRVERIAGNQELGVHHPLERTLWISEWSLLWKLPWECRTVLRVYDYNLKVTWIACRIARLSCFGLMIWCTPEPVGVFWSRCTPSEGEGINVIQRVVLMEAHHRNTGDVFGWRLVNVWMMVVVLGCSALRLTRAFHNV